MKIYEARFYPETKKVGQPVVVARVVFADDGATVQPLEVRPARIDPFNSAALIERVHFLVDAARSSSPEQLTGVHSDFWSFVEVGANGPASR